MTNLEQRFYAAVSGNAGVAALLGVGTASRLYHQTVRQLPTYPAAAYQRIATRRVMTIQQASNWMSSGWARFQFTILDTDDVRLIQVMDAIRASLKTFDLSSDTGVSDQAPNLVVRETVDVQPETKPPVFVALMDTTCFFRDVN